MKEFVRYCSNSYYETLVVDDEAAEAAGVEISIPDGFKPLVKLEDERPDPENPRYIKLIFQEDKVYYKLYDQLLEISSDNVHVIPLEQFLYVDLPNDLTTPTEIQNDIKEYLSLLRSPEYQAWYTKVSNEDYLPKILQNEQENVLTTEEKASV